MADLIIKTIIVGVLDSMFILVLLLLTLDTAYFDDALTWIALIISIGAGVIITIIVDKRTSDSHQEVIKSQIEISHLLKRLEHTDLLHHKVLDKLDASRVQKEELAKHSIIISLCYIFSILSKLISSLNEKNLNAKDMQLITNVLNHLESPLNIIEQSIPHTDTDFQKYELDVQNITKLLRKLIIASISVSRNEVKITFELVQKTNNKLEKVIKKIS